MTRTFFVAGSRKFFEEIEEFVKQCRERNLNAVTAYEDGNYSVIAGHLDGDEEIRTAMVREAWEEAGIDISPDHLQVVGVMHRKSDDERIDFFLATSTWSGEIVNREPTRCDQLAWFDLGKLPENMVPYVRRALDDYRQGKWFDSFGWS